jgi:predicted anti-sigma-YlaC factor YlaD
MAHLDPVTFRRLYTALLLMPWVVNGVVLVWAFIFRPQIGIGYITSFGAILIAMVGLAMIAFVSCVASTPFIFVAGPLGILVFFGLGLAGFVWLVKSGLEQVGAWWSAYDGSSSLSVTTSRRPSY